MELPSVGGGVESEEEGWNWGPGASKGQQAEEFVRGLEDANTSD